MKALLLMVCCVLLTASTVSAEKVKKMGFGPPTKAEMLAREKAEAEAAAKRAEAAKNGTLTIADCQAEGPAWDEDYGYCILDLAAQDKDIYVCPYLNTRGGARECVESVMKLTKVTSDDCKKMTDYVDVCQDLVKEQSK